jgi:uncharacterized phage protein (TIGR01671 family)
MKEIKFRGKNIHNEWVYGDLAHVELNTTKGTINKMYILEHKAVGGMLYIGKRWRVDENTIGQFTGIYDKDGREIYEGDIMDYSLSTPFEEESHLWGVVFNNKGYFQLSEYLRLDGGYNIQDIVSTEPEAFVVGNIYDNKNLME